MKALFLTSSPTGPLDGSRGVEGLDGMNGFPDRLRAVWPDGARCLMIAAMPQAYERNDGMTAFFREALRLSGFGFRTFDLWDARKAHIDLNGYDVVWLGGGHVPTQNRWFRQIELREAIQRFGGIVIGISAGTMNCAETVYAQPEEPGEAIDPAYRRYLPGLGLTRVNVLPHYQMTRDYWLDGKRLFEDITYPDSFGEGFIALTDGAYILRADGGETVYGEAYRIRNGQIKKLCGTDGEYKMTAGE